MGLVDWLRRRDAAARPPSGDLVRLRPAAEVIERYRDEGGDADASIRGALRQLAGLRREIDDDERWGHLVRMARQAGDPWNADDWPLGFDALVCATTLCTHVAFECPRCPVGQRQDGRSCAHPQTAFGRINVIVRQGDREGLRAHVEALTAMLSEALHARG